MIDIKDVERDIMHRIKYTIDASINAALGILDELDATRTFSDAEKARDFYAINSLKEEIELRMFGTTETSKKFEHSMSFINILNSRYDLYIKDTNVRLDKRIIDVEEERDCNFYTIKDGEKKVGYYGFQGGLTKVCEKLEFLEDGHSFTSVTGFKAHPDYFILIGDDLYIYECKHVAERTPKSQFLRQAGVCFAFDWYYKTLAPDLKLRTHFTAILSKGFGEEANKDALDFLDEQGVKYVINQIPNLPL